MVRFFKNPFEDMIKNEPRPKILPDDYQEWDKIEIDVYLSNKPSNYEYVDKNWPPRLLGKCIGIAYANISPSRGRLWIGKEHIEVKKWERKKDNEEKLLDEHTNRLENKS